MVMRLKPAAHYLSNNDEDIKSSVIKKKCVPEDTRVSACTHGGGARGYMSVCICAWRW